MSKPLPRTFVHVVHDAKRRVWRAEVEGQTVRIFPDRLSAIKLLAAHFDHMWKTWRIRSELIVHTKTGRIGKGTSGRRTYGEDNPRVKG